MKQKKTKTKHRIWKCFLTILVILVLAGAYLMYRYMNTKASRLNDRYPEEIETFISTKDKDGDGIDDQTDILEGVMAYIKTEPQYKSRYYDSGYPDDEYGVCTDVVGAGLKAAGYDLRELVDQDIKAHPDDYDIDEPDNKIDFRRVRNLLVYFRHNAIELTKDTSQITEWQGGDIVIYPGHIGIVSDRRNEKGLPYLIHHSNPLQKRYEQDVLDSWGEIRGHFRVSE